MNETVNPNSRLSLRPIILLIAWGLILWGSGVLILRWAASSGALDGAAQVFSYGAIVVATIPLILVTPRIAGVPRSETFAAVAIVLTTALFIDGVVIGYFPQIYAVDPVQARGCAGALLWAAGVTLALGFILQPRAG